MKLSIFAISFVFSLTLLSCVGACDVNGTANVEDQFFTEDSVVYEYGIADTSLISTDDEIIPSEENSDGYTIINDTTSSFGIVDNNIKDECDLDIENNDARIMISQFCDVKNESEILDATLFNNNISINYFSDLNVSIDDLSSFEVLLIKMEDYESDTFKDEEFKNSFTFKQELLFSILYDAFNEVIVDFYIIVCGNKLWDDFAYSINNSIIGDKSNVHYYSSYFFINQNCTNFNNAPNFLVIL